MKRGTMMRVIRTVAGPRAWIFNDRLKDGRRSVKIWGIGFRYGPVAEALMLAGFAVRIRKDYGGEPRLHVWDFNA